MNGRFGLSLSFSLSLLLVAATMSQMLQQVQGRRKFCGEALNEALDLICVNGFSRRIKRNHNSRLTPRLKWCRPRIRMPHPVSGSPCSTNWMESRERARERTQAREQQQTAREHLATEKMDTTCGVIVAASPHECCRDGCTYEDILEYCA
ncbi:GL16361 [Drosophila persimilis]|uniref:GL16361 n=1 Tax=Drosophila persimilis TaxID=7234 RepID=B4ISH4_DROPE|nr:GL16361 [Drosophila persimilis]